MSVKGNSAANPYESPRTQRKQQQRSGKPSHVAQAAKITTSFFLAAAFGAGLWWLSPSMTGHEEPWDASLVGYLLTLLIGGFVFAAICPRWFLVPVLGLYLGQIAFCLGNITGNWAMVILMLVSLAFHGIPPSFVGAFTVFASSQAWKWFRPCGESPE